MAKKCLFNLVFGLIFFGWLAGAGFLRLWHATLICRWHRIFLAPGLSEFDGGQVVLTNRRGALFALRLSAWRQKAQAMVCRLFIAKPCPIWDGN